MRTKETGKRLKALTAYDNNAVSILQWYQSAGSDSDTPFDFEAFVKDIDAVFGAAKSIIDDFKFRQKFLLEDKRDARLKKEIKEWSNTALNCGYVRPLLELALKDILTFESVCNCLFGWCGVDEDLVNLKDVKRGAVAVLVYAGLKIKSGKQYSGNKNNAVNGLNTGLTFTQITKLHCKLKDAGFIDKNTDIDSFNFVLGEGAMPDLFKPIKWIKLNDRGRHKGNINKTSLYYLCSELTKDKRTEANLTSEQRQTVKSLFVDSNGSEIILPKPVKEDYGNSQLEQDIASIIKEI